MIPKSGYRFSEKIMLKQPSMIPKSGYRFSEKIMLKQPSMIPKSGYRFCFGARPGPAVALGSRLPLRQPRPEERAMRMRYVEDPEG
jgi:hypothetical protein